MEAAMMTTKAFDSSCQHANAIAPQRDADNVRGVSTGIESWCASVDGHEVTSDKGGIDRAFELNILQAVPFGYWLSAKIRNKDNACGTTQKIAKDECTTFLTLAMETCDPDSGDTHGGMMATQCMEYSIVLDDQVTDGQDPPWNRQLKTSDPTMGVNTLDTGCKPESSGVQTNFWKGVYPQFCSKVNFKSNKQQAFDLTNKDFVAPSTKRSLTSSNLTRRTPPVNGNLYTDKKFKFVWYPKNGPCSDDCNTAMNKLAQTDCGLAGSQQMDMSPYGNIDVHCGSYAYWIN
ncbi:hypothetical protein BT63DRAFT_256815 [Microthyrium microscopicum]|uniref:Uncharacterized protein n=1 Tax=Microthyrium microscopicum TaxID=703497 RepID=A0A6A6UEI4_9PEZI|nr:hypothetical protein BT63DRAFT_256815 [Microthyrium microscopicum]